MPYFPMFVDLIGRPCLIVGGGPVAARKAAQLAPYGPDLRVVAPAFVPGFQGCTLLRRPYLPGDEDGMALVIAATDDAPLNHQISRACRAKNIPVNVVDDKEHCTFLFPALVQAGELSIGISTGGASPTAARWMKEQILPLVPDNMGAILSWLEGQRPRVKAAFSDKRDRSARLSALFFTCLDRGRPLTEEEMEGSL